MMASAAAINNLGPTAHNPRGNLWFNDDTTFGHKLLMKMGWQKGKGLGKNEDGIKENLKVKFKSTNSGLGFKDDAYANVMKNEYESILKDLKPQYSAQVTPNSTNDVEKPKKSKVVKNRLRYPKLFFGKDVNKYSEKDMKSIFICSQQVQETQEKEDCKVIKETELENDLSKSVKDIKSDLSISEYFAMKMKEKKSNILNKSATVHSDLQTSFESSKSKTENSMDNVKLSSKRKRKCLEMNTDEEYTNELHMPIMQFKDIKTESLVECTAKSLSKKRKKKSEISNMLDKVNSYTSENDHKNHQNLSADSSRVFLGNFSEKDEKPHVVQNEYSVTDTTERISENFPNADVSASSKKKKKKKRHGSPTAVEHSLKELSEKNQLEPTFGKEKLKSSETINGFNYSNISDSELLNGKTTGLEKKNKQKKKKLKQKLKSCLKSKKDSYSMKNVSFNENVSYRIIDSDIDSVEDLAGDQSMDLDQLFSSVNSATNVSLTSVDETESNESHCTSHDDINSVKQVTFDEDDVTTNNNTTTTNESKSDEITFNSDLSKDLENVSGQESNEMSALNSLPSSKSSHYNFWIESQRQALKMNIYKKMLQNIGTHDLLRTTNLLSIQGYGNWGFK